MLVAILSNLILERIISNFHEFVGSNLDNTYLFDFIVLQLDVNNHYNHEIYNFLFINLVKHFGLSKVLEKIKEFNLKVDLKIMIGE